MRVSKLYAPTLREVPAEAEVVSHQLMLRAGFMRKAAGGIYTYLPLAWRVLKKIERIVREEMDAKGSQELLMPIVQPAEIWQESGRWDVYGAEMFRLQDRHNRCFCLGPTHEEMVTTLIRGDVRSYRQLPLSVYQIQNKYRDEIRPRFGLMRGREFIMKDAYSFHTSQEDLEQYYDKCHKAYERIYARAGIPEVVSVKSDSGMMGGNVSHEFMLLTPIGEDSIVICNECDYRANMEAAENIVENETEAMQELTKVHTPEMHTIEQVCEFLHVDAKKSMKAVVYQRNSDDKYILIFVRGDLEINETKLTNYLGCDVHPGVITEESGIQAGFIGPVNQNADCIVLFDRSLKGTTNLVCGANEVDYHYTGLNMEREFPDAEYVDLAKVVEGGICPCCGKKSLTISRGIEVGNIFQLGTKYTKTMNMTYVDKDGTSKNPIMGCYGIGVGRMAASICEAHHDDYGPIWPMSIAPWQVHICAMNLDKEGVREVADSLYENLQNAGVEVIYDDRSVSAGNKFSDADLLGVPVRVVVSPRNLKESVVEVSTRDKSLMEKVPVENAEQYVKDLVEKMKKECNLVK